MGDVTIIGAGLAGCEAAWQLARRGHRVTLHDLKPEGRTPAQASDTLAELVCSNSLRAANVENAVGLLKEEMRRLSSLIMQAADATRVPAGGALAVDREKFSRFITDRILNDPLIAFVSGEVTAIPDEGVVIVATGPLTTGALFEDIAQVMGEQKLYFFDAAAPIVSFESIDMDTAFFASRYGKGSDDYINCPMDREQYLAFHEALVSAEQAELHGFENSRVFEGCMPIEVMAKRGEDTIRFGPLKPVGIVNPKTGREAYAIVQLRRDNAEGTLYNLVGFQTHLKFPEQRRVFRMIPGLENAEFMRYGVMHRNTYLHSPGLLNSRYEAIRRPGLFFAGQITGVEGYVESAASGLAVGIHAARLLEGREPLCFSADTAIGALGCYIANRSVTDFQPMNVNFGIISPPNFKFRGKRNKNEMLAARALSEIDRIAAQIQEDDR